MDSYIYNRIDLAQPTIRLVRLLRGINIDLECEIFQAWLDQPQDRIPYEALSYTWGSTERTDHVTINGRKLTITQNLYLALEHLRFKEHDRILWIDSLCIDQANDAEKGHQVRQMGDIYQRAERVVIWLDVGTCETNVIIDSMKLLEEECIYHSKNISEQARREIWLNIQPILMSMHPDLKDQQNDSLELLFRRSWFRRVWIIQEVANARAAIVVCGAKSVSARTFALVPSLMGIEPNPHCQSILDIMPGRSREKSWWSQKRDLQTLLVKFAKSDASDPRDKIYALLGLSYDACDTDHLRADYSKPESQVIKEATLFLFQNLQIPELLQLTFPCHWTMSQFFNGVCLLSNLALRWAQEEGNTYIISLLLAHDDIDLNLMDEIGRTPLHMAVQRQQWDIVRLFLTRDDIDVNLRDWNGDTPLQTAVKTRGVEGVRRLLKRYDIDVDSKDRDGNTPLQVAVEHRDSSVVRELLASKGIDVNLKGLSGEALQWMVSQKPVDSQSSDCSYNYLVAFFLVCFCIALCQLLWEMTRNTWSYQFLNDKKGDYCV
jgi:hypothetical protein